MATNHNNTMMGEEVQQLITNKNATKDDDNDIKSSSPIPSHHVPLSSSPLPEPRQHQQQQPRGINIDGGGPPTAGQPFTIYVKCEPKWRQEPKQLKVVEGTTVAQLKQQLSSQFPELGATPTFCLKYGSQRLADTLIFDSNSNNIIGSISTTPVNTIMILKGPGDLPSTYDELLSLHIELLDKNQKVNTSLLLSILCWNEMMIIL
jgi:hypothetical protein